MNDSAMDFSLLQVLCRNRRTSPDAIIIYFSDINRIISSIFNHRSRYSIITADIPHKRLREGKFVKRVFRSTETDTVQTILMISIITLYVGKSNHFDDCKLHKILMIFIRNQLHVVLLFSLQDMFGL